MSNEKIGRVVLQAKNGVVRYGVVTTETTKGYLLLCRKKTNITYYISAFTLPKNSIIVIPKNTIHSDCFIYGDIITSYNTNIKYSSALLQYYKNIVKFNIITI